MCQLPVLCLRMNYKLNASKISGLYVNYAPLNIIPSPPRLMDGDFDFSKNL